MKSKKKNKGLDQMTIFECDGVSSAVGHGGKRQGSGRHKREATVVMRVPESLAEQVKELIRQHKEQSG